MYYSTCPNKREGRCLTCISTNSPSAADTFFCEVKQPFEVLIGIIFLFYFFHQDINGINLLMMMAMRRRTMMTKVSQF